MNSLRCLLSMAVMSYIAGAGQTVFAQETNPTVFNVTLEPVQYAAVKGNVGKFRALNWMKDGADGGISDITFIKEINKNISLDVGGSAFAKTNNYDDHLVLRDGDLAFLKIDYKSFRKYFDGTGGVFRDNNFNPTLSGAKPNSPDLQMDISYFKLEAGVGPISDPFLDIAYEHNTKEGAKSLLMWGAATSGAAVKNIAPSFETVDDTVDVVTLKEKKDFAGITIKGEQRAEVDYNHNLITMPFLNLTPATPSSANQIRTENEYPDAKLFSSGVWGEKWMFNDKTFVGFGYHFNHTRASELMQNQQTTDTGVLANYNAGRQTFWNLSNVRENEHVFTGNFNTNLTPDLTFITDVKYEHIGSEGSSVYLEENPTATAAGPAPNGTIFSRDHSNMDNNQDREGEHVSLRYSGISHTSLYAESDLEQARNWVAQSFSSSHTPSSNFFIERLNRTQKESWTLGGEVVPNRFFIFKNQVRQRWEDNEYDTLRVINPTAQTFLDALKINGIEESSTVTWKPYRWIQNSLRYQFLDTVYMPRAAAEGSGLPQFSIARNHMLSSVFTYDISVQPIDPVLLMLSYSHVENYVRTLAASSTPNIPTFNSGDNSWLFSASYTPTEYVTLTNTATYTISPNYVDFSTGVPLGTSFRQLTLSTGIQWTLHKWLKIGPTYEYASYRDNPLAGVGNYSANIFRLDMSFDW
jgi:hypothetical protein